MTAADAAWLRMDRPANLMVINALEWFESEPDWGAVQAAIVERIAGRFPRFRQLPQPGGLLSGARWRDDPAFEPAAHFHRHTLPAPHDRGALRALVGDLATAPLDHARPLWRSTASRAAATAPCCSPGSTTRWRTASRCPG